MIIGLFWLVTILMLNYEVQHLKTIQYSLPDLLWEQVPWYISVVLLFDLII